MLVLTREIDQFLTLIHKETGAVLGQIGIVDIRSKAGNKMRDCKARIGLELPDSIEILRDELLDGWRGRGNVPDSGPPMVPADANGRAGAG